MPSPRQRNHRRLTGWIALLAVWFAALAPVVSHALVWTGAAASGLDVCTAAGAQPLSLDAGLARPDAAPLHDVLEHCAFCVLGAGAAPLASVGPALPTVFEPSGQVAQPVFLPALPGLAWRLLPSRAPPLAS